MPKKKGRTESSGTAIELVTSNKTVSRDREQKHIDGVKRQVKAMLSKRNLIQREASKYLSMLPQRTPLSRADAAKAKAGLREVNKRLSSQKLAVPKVRFEPPGLYSYALRLGAPYGYIHTEHDLAGVGNVATVNADSGAVNLSLADNGTDAILHYAFAEIGNYFIPPANPATMTVSINPAYSFAWWLNSLGPIAATSQSMGLTITSFTATKSQQIGAAGIDLWNEYADGPGVQFDAGSGNAPLSATVPLKTNTYYLISLRCLLVAGVGHYSPADGIGYAGSEINLVLPPINIEVRTQPVIVATT